MFAAACAWLAGRMKNIAKIAVIIALANIIFLYFFRIFAL